MSSFRQLAIELAEARAKEVGLSMDVHSLYHKVMLMSPREPGYQEELLHLAKSLMHELKKKTLVELDRALAAQRYEDLANGVYREDHK